MLKCPPAFVCDVCCPRSDLFPFIPPSVLSSAVPRRCCGYLPLYILYKTRPSGIKFSHILVLLVFSFLRSIYKNADCCQHSVGLRAGGRCSNCGRSKEFFCTPQRSHRFRPPSSSLDGVFSGRSGKADHSPPSSLEVNNDAAIYPLPLSFYGVVLI
jgi:hypothetical protein